MDRFHPMQIAHIKIGERHRKDLGDLESLAADIKENGMLHPIVVERDTRELIAGQRRLEAAKLLGWKKVTVHRVSMQEIVRGEFAENAERKDFLPTEIEAIRRAMEPVEKEAAKGRMGRGENQTPKGSTRDKVAKVAGVSGAAQNCDGAVKQADDERGGAEPEAAIMGPQSPEDAKPGMGSLPGDDLEIPEFLRRT